MEPSGQGFTAFFAMDDMVPRGISCRQAPQITRCKAWPLLLRGSPLFAFPAAARRWGWHFSSLRRGAGSDVLRGYRRGLRCAAGRHLRALRIRPRLFALRLAWPECGSCRLAPGRSGRPTFFGHARLRGFSGGAGVGCAAWRRSFVRGPCPAGAHYARTAECARFRCGGDSRTAVVDGRP